MNILKNGPCPLVGDGRDNKLTKAMDCLEEITGACQGSSDQEHYLRNMLDVNKERRLVAFFCSHLKGEFPLDAQL